MINRWIRFGLVAVAATGIAVGTGLWQSNPMISVAQGSVPAAVQPCLQPGDSNPFVRTSLMGNVPQSGRTYYLFHAYKSNNNQSDLVISVANGRCQTEFSNPGGDRMPMHGAVPLEVAQQLTLKSFQSAIRRDGKAKVAQRVQQAAAQGFTFYPEEIWALRQLGINLPNARIDSTTRSRG